MKTTKTRTRCENGNVVNLIWWLYNVWIKHWKKNELSDDDIGGGEKTKMMKKKREMKLLTTTMFYINENETLIRKKSFEENEWIDFSSWSSIWFSIVFFFLKNFKNFVLFFSYCFIIWNPRNQTKLSIWFELDDENFWNFFFFYLGFLFIYFSGYIQQQQQGLVYQTNITCQNKTQLLLSIILSLVACFCSLYKNAMNFFRL